jgi:drug/metabolite transporter (DMT)-like permease
MLSVAVAALSSIFYGVADFIGGSTSKRLHVLQVVAISAPASLAVEILLIPVFGATWSWEAAGWGALSGLASAAAFTLLYAALARGPMGILSPITAVISAAVPVAVGFIVAAAAPGPLKVLGLVIAAPAVVLLSLGSAPAKSSPPRTSSLLIAAGAGLAIGTQLVFLHAAPADSGVVPLIVGRAVASVILGVAAAIVLPRVRAGRPSWRLMGLAALAGALDSLANLAFLISSRLGDLAVSGMIVALYPAATVVLAWIVLRERLGWKALVGIVLALVGVALLAI